MQEYISFDSDNELYIWQIVRALEGEASPIDLNDGYDTDTDTTQHREDMAKLARMALGTKQHGGSSEVSGSTSEHGVNLLDSSSGEPAQPDHKGGK